MLKAPNATFPIQEDGYNCGIFVFLTILDFVLTQWNREWTYDKIDVNNKPKKESQTKLESKDPIFGFSRSWTKDHIDVNHYSKKDLRAHLESPDPIIVLPDSFGIGTTLLERPVTGRGRFYTKICNLIRMEMCVLFERVYCVFYNAFSANGMVCDVNVFGQVRKIYSETMGADHQMKHVYHKIYEKRCLAK